MLSTYPQSSTAEIRNDLEPQGDESPTHWIDQSVGRRYMSCTLNSYVANTQAQRDSVAECRDYIMRFGEFARDGVSLIFIGPKGTGKDHLMVATIYAICRGYPSSPQSKERAVYRDGLRLFAEFRGAISNRSSADEDTIVDRYVKPHLLAISDPLPPAGSLSEYEQRMLLRIIDGRYRDCRPTAATCNVGSRAELENRIGPQAADRLLDSAKVIKCNWESYRQTRSRSESA